MQQTIHIDGRPRTFIVAGEQHAQPGRDLVLVFHGSRQTGATHRRFTGGMYDELASGSVVIAYLDGFGGNWNDSRRQSSFPARVNDVDDVGFAEAVIDRLRRTHGIDTGRVFAVGYSNGGQFVFRLAHERPERFAGIAAFSATMPTPDSFLAPEHDSRTPLPTLLIHGTKDPIVPVDGGTMRRCAQGLFKVGGSTLSAMQTADYFARRNGITSMPVSAPVIADHGRVWTERIDYRDGTAHPVRLLLVHGAGHTVPGPKSGPLVLGRTAHDVSAADEIATFFGLKHLTGGTAAHYAEP